MIHKVSERVKSEILKKSAFSLPDKPSEYGYTASDIKKAFYAPLCGTTDSVITEIDRLAEEVNEEIEVLAGYDNEVLIQVNGLNNKINGGINRITALEANEVKTCQFYVDTGRWRETDQFNPFWFFVNLDASGQNIDMVELVNDNPVAFSKSGFSIIKNGMFKLLATSRPESRITFTIRYIGDNLIVQNMSDV